MGQAPQQQKPNTPEPNPLRGAALWPLMLLGMVLLVMYAQNPGVKGRLELVPYSEFRQAVREGQVTDVTLEERRLVGTWAAPQQHEGNKQFVVNRAGDSTEADLQKLLVDHNVKFQYQPPSQFTAMLYLFLFLLGTFVLLTVVMRRMNPAERAMSFGKSRHKQYVERDIKVTFDDVAGIEEPKNELQEIVEYLRMPEKYRRLGGKIPKGVLLVGAPGTGKTLLAKAVAGEAKVPFFSMSGSDFVELFVGVGASRVRDLFRQAEAHSPCIVFIDELDALGKARGASLLGGGHDEREQTLNQLLVEMDGFDSNTNVIIMAATNRPEILDQALMRPGRFDRQVMIPAPDITGREAILKVHAQEITLDPTVDLRLVAARTPGFVGADLANVVNEAALLAARRERDAVVFEDFDEAIDRVSIGLERKSQVMSDEEKRVTAYHEAGHAVAASFTPGADTVHKVSIIPRGWAGGFTQFVNEEDRHLVTETRLRSMMCSILGGRTAEELIFGELSTGAADDIRRVTEIARSMVTELGMSPKLGPLNYDGTGRPDPLGLGYAGMREISEDTARQIDTEIRRLVDQAHDDARTVLGNHTAELERLATRLLEVEVVDHSELCSLLGLPTKSDDDSAPDNVPGL